jgi:hypothetical protein
MASRDEREAAKSFTTIARETVRAIIGAGIPLAKILLCWSVSAWPSSENESSA